MEICSEIQLLMSHAMPSIYMLVLPPCYMYEKFFCREMSQYCQASKESHVWGIHSMHCVRIPSPDWL